MLESTYLFNSAGCSICMTLDKITDAPSPSHYKEAVLLERLRLPNHKSKPDVREMMEEALPLILEKAQAMGKA